MILPANTPSSVFFVQLSNTAPLLDSQHVQSITVTNTNSTVLQTSVKGALVDGGDVYANSQVRNLSQQTVL